MQNGAVENQRYLEKLVRSEAAVRWKLKTYNQPTDPSLRIFTIEKVDSISSIQDDKPIKIKKAEKLIEPSTTDPQKMMQFVDEKKQADPIAIGWTNLWL